MANYKPRYGLDGRAVKSLYEYYWRRRGSAIQGRGWRDFNDFVRWCAENGYQKYYKLRRRDASKPHGPCNSFWERNDTRQAELDKLDLQTPEENPCDTCRNAPYCESICPLRAAWWDVGMERVRRFMRERVT